MEALTALFAGVIDMLRGAVPNAVCPGGWPWAVTAFGVLIGLLPTVGLVAVALARRGMGSRYRFPEAAFLVGNGLLTAGFLPLIAFTTTGRIFTVAATGIAPNGISAAGDAELGAANCLGGSQADYLGGDTVLGWFGGGAVRATLAVVLLAGAPAFATLFVAGQARLALRRGPAWPAKFFWLPTLALPFVTANVAGGSSGHLWLGYSFAALIGLFVLLIVGVPSRSRIEQADRARVAALPAPPSRAGATDRRSATDHRPPPVTGTRNRPSATDHRPPPVTGARKQPATGTRERLAGRLAQRFAEPPVVAESDAESAPRPRPPTGPNGTKVAREARAYPPTSLAPGPPFPAAAGGGPDGARFQMLRRLGSGGFGRVWLAYDARSGQRVALKSAHAPDQETEERIQREFRALAAVRHPNCVRIFDMVPARSDPGLTELDGMVLVMEFVDGPSLAELIRTRGVLDDVAAARAWIGVAGALDAAHDRGVMHRDVKPGNVVIDSSGLAHLIDFGIARKTGDATLTVAGFVLGTPDFLAPEVACGERATPASDSWQLAATMSFALTGQPPRGSHADAISGLRAAAAGAPLSHLPARSAHLALLRAALDTEPARRPPLRLVQRTLTDWLRRTGAQPDGPVSAARVR